MPYFPRRLEMVAKAGAQRSAKKLIRVQTLRLDLKKRKTWEVRDLTGGLGSSKKKKKKNWFGVSGVSPCIYTVWISLTMYYAYYK